MKYMLMHCVDESLEPSPEDEARAEAVPASWIEVASKHPVAKFGTVEVRPFWQT